MKKLLKVFGCLLLCLVLVAGAGIAYLSLTEYKPADVEPAAVSHGAGTTTYAHLSEGQSVSVLNWNIGYGALGAEADFFMDGGKSVRGKDLPTVTKYLNDIWNTVHLREEPYDFVLYQEVDQDAARSCGLDERILLSPSGTWSYAPNYETAFVPYPMPPLGRVHSGLMTDTSSYQIEEALRVALPCPFSWPLRTVNLKRCLLVTYLPIEGSDKKLSLVNLHLEAYSSEDGRDAQMRQLSRFLESEYQKGNYVIAGGDFNQVFPDTTERYPITTAELWEPGVLSLNDLPEGFRFVWDAETPSCRLLNAPYDPKTTQHYVIDGFILSPNVVLESVETLDQGFASSDHNPVELHVRLGA
ncbi:MAG: endonuclease [Oscillospiraceae bacterium]|nr:endonuclease [Oscillospiraceae bacterium]